jgi:hypothetical protein
MPWASSISLNFATLHDGFIGNGDISIKVKNSWAGRKTVNNQSIVSSFHSQWPLVKTVHLYLILINISQNYLCFLSDFNLFAKNIKAILISNSMFAVALIYPLKHWDSYFPLLDQDSILNSNQKKKNTNKPTKQDKKKYEQTYNFLKDSPITIEHFESRS